MLATTPSTEAIWSLLEKLFLDDGDANSRAQYPGLNEHEKRDVLKAFASQQSLKSQRWIEISKMVRSL